MKSCIIIHKVFSKFWLFFWNITLPGNGRKLRILEHYRFVFEQQFFFISQCFISIDAEFQCKSIDVHYLWVLFHNLSIINQILFQWRWIESGHIQENSHFYLFEMDEYFFYNWAKGHFLILRIKREIVANLKISPTNKKFGCCGSCKIKSCRIEYLE
jgi:hypothetical protein